MAYLLDANILIRFVDASDPQHTLITAAIRKLEQDGETLYLAPQPLVEAYAVTTRPTAAKGGLGKTPQQGVAMVQVLLSLFSLLPDRPDTFSLWLEQVEEFGVSGVQSHDCRLVAFMRAHGVTNLLTLNGKDFQRYAPLGIVVTAPADVAGISTGAPRTMTATDPDASSTETRTS